MLEPYVLKGTRTVLRRGETSNCLFLFDVIASPHPHKKNIDTNPLNVQFIPGLKKPENSCTIKLNIMFIKNDYSHIIELLFMGCEFTNIF